MNPQVTAAVIAAVVSGITLIVTSVAQILSRLGTKKDLENQREQLDRTLGEQRLRTLNERFATAAGQLGSDKPAAVRLAGVYAMAGQAEDWEENRQTCVDVLCGYLRLPYDPEPGDDADPAKRTAYLANREVRHTAIRVITAHLQVDAAVSWQGLDLDFTGVVFDGGDFGGAEFSGGMVSFDSAVFAGGQVIFWGAEFSGGMVSFGGAKFSRGTVIFEGARFSGGKVIFDGARFSGGTVDFGRARFSGGMVSFFAKFSGGEVSFDRAEFSGGSVRFFGAEFSGGTVDFSRVAVWTDRPYFDWGDSTPASGVKLPDPRLSPGAETGEMA